MSALVTRRGALFLPLLLAACGDDAPVPETRHDFAPLRYGYLPPIELNVARVRMASDFVPPSGGGELIGASPVDPVETLTAMAHDRLKPVGANGTATFRVLTASIVRRGDTLNGVLAVRLDVRNDEDTSSGFIEARSNATHGGAISDQRAVLYDMMQTMMEKMNVEFEYQIRNRLTAWVAAPANAAPAPSRPVDPSANDMPVPPRPVPPPPDVPAAPPPTTDQPGATGRNDPEL